MLTLFTSPASQALDLVTLQLKWLHQFQFAGYYAALEKGFYRDAGLEVEIREGGPNVDAIDDVVNGGADFGVGTSGASSPVRAGNRSLCSLRFFNTPQPFFWFRAAPGSRACLRCRTAY